MKYVKIIIFIMYLIVYGYSVHMTSVKPDETYWSYICIVAIGYIFMKFVNFILSRPEKKTDGPLPFKNV
jgi:hypothetical protein